MKPVIFFADLRIKQKNTNIIGDFLNDMLQQANCRGVQYLVGLARTERLVFATLGDIAAEEMFRASALEILS